MSFPNSFTHGSSEQRQRWFETGLKSASTRPATPSGQCAKFSVISGSRVQRGCLGILNLRPFPKRSIRGYVIFGLATSWRPGIRAEEVPCSASINRAQFIPLKIAVLTVSDTRSLDEDKSGATLAERIEKAGHAVGARAIVTDDVEKIRAQAKAWIVDPAIDVVVTTGVTGFTGRDWMPEALEPLFEKRMEGFATLFLMVSHAKIGTSAIQTRVTAGVAGATYIFCLPGSPGACRDAWDEILLHQLDYRYRPCNFVEIMPRLDEHLRRAKAKGATA